MFLKKFQIEFLNKILKRKNNDNKFIEYNIGNIASSADINDYNLTRNSLSSSDKSYPSKVNTSLVKDTNSLVKDSDNGDEINVFDYVPKSDKEELKSFDVEQGTVIYYRLIDRFLVYRVVHYSSSRGYSMCTVDLSEFETLDDLKIHYKSMFKKVNFMNLLSVDYVYLFKSGVYVEGEDLRSQEQILNDNIVHCLYSNGFLNEVLIHNNKYTFNFYNPFHPKYSRKNIHGWSYEIIDKYLIEGRIKIFLSSDTLFSYDDISRNIISNPSSLLFELKVVCNSSDSSLNSCSNLGIQIG